MKGLKQVAVRISPDLDKRAEIAVAHGLAPTKRELFAQALEEYLERQKHAIPGAA